MAGYVDECFHAVVDLDEKDGPVLRMRPVTWQVSWIRTALIVVK